MTQETKVTRDEFLTCLLKAMETALEFPPDTEYVIITDTKTRLISFGEATEVNRDPS